MSNLKYILPLCALLFMGVSCKNETAPEIKTAETAEIQQEKVLNPDGVYTTASFSIEGMKCALGCAKVIEKNLFAMNGVSEDKVDFESHMATVTYDVDVLKKEDLEASVTATSDSYKVTSWQNTENPAIEKE